MPEQKQSSTVSAQRAYTVLLEVGFRPLLVQGVRSIQTTAWDAVIRNQDVVHSASNKSIILVNDEGVEIVLKTKGMLSANEVAFIETTADIDFK